MDFAASAGNAKSLLERAQKPTALRSLIAEQRQDDTLINFADEVLTAQSWYRGQKPAQADEAIRAMIDQVARGEKTPEEAIDLAVQKVNETF